MLMTFWLNGFLEVKLKDPMQDINREIAIMKKLDHPNIIKLFEVLDQSDSDKLFLGNFSSNSPINPPQ